MLRATLVALVVLLSACGGRPETPDGQGAAGDPSATAKSGDQPEESDSERRRRLAQERRQQCEELSSAIQGSLHEDTIVNETNAEALRKLAEELEQGAKGIVEAEVDIPEIAKLRDEYLANLHDMSEAMLRAATAKGDKDRKKALKAFAEHESRSAPIMGRLTERCNAPIK